MLIYRSYTRKKIKKSKVKSQECDIHIKDSHIILGEVLLLIILATI